MNQFHRHYCASKKWEKLMRESLLPTLWPPSPSATICWSWDQGLARRPWRWPDCSSGHGRRDRPGTSKVARREQTRSCGNVEVVEGDATALPFDDARFSSVVGVTMLHHLHDAAAQDRLVANVRRVLRPGGVLCGSDNLGRG